MLPFVLPRRATSAPFIGSTARSPTRSPVGSTATSSCSSPTASMPSWPPPPVKASHSAWSSGPARGNVDLERHAIAMSELVAGESAREGGEPINQPGPAEDQHDDEGQYRPVLAGAQAIKIGILAIARALARLGVERGGGFDGLSRRPRLAPVSGRAVFERDDRHAPTPF